MESQKLPETTFLRSEVMSLAQFYIPSEISKQTIGALGELGLVQFRDLNKEVNAFQRTFVSDIRHYDEVARQIRFLKTQIEREDIKIKKSTVEEAAVSKTPKELEELEQKISETEKVVIELNENQRTLDKRYLELTEMRHVIKVTDEFFESSNVKEIQENNLKSDSTTGLLKEENAAADLEAGKKSSVTFVAGVIPRAKINGFERLLWRMLRGNLYMKNAEIEEPIKDPETNELVEKNVFIVFVHGQVLLNKIRKLCESVGATVYPVSENAEQRNEEAIEVLARIEDLDQVLNNTRETRMNKLREIAQNIDAWNTVIRKEKAIYHVMNLLRTDKNSMIAEGWVPTNKIPEIQQCLRDTAEAAGSNVAPIMNEVSYRSVPPTYNVTNKFTKCFQSIVDSYGVSNYREINPALYTIVTFPFLFAIMFGDLGHGTLMFLGALAMVIFEKKLYNYKNEIFEMIFSGRYVILLMGAFSIFTGLVYNDCFSKPLNLFTQNTYSYKEIGNSTEGGVSLATELGTYQRTYAFGMDPAWVDAENKLVFQNSYKMKMSVVIGVIHMLFGTIISLFNYLHFKSFGEILVVFLPELLYMGCIFGYLTFTIIYKWCTHWEGSQAPGLMNMLIYMFLSPGTVEKNEELFPNQGKIQLILLLIAVIAIPVLLLGRPFLQKMKNKNVEELPTTNDVVAYSERDYKPPAWSFAEAFINQGVHTIEYCLSGISHTASYLRLWALSLAHGQLSEVLWNMLLDNIFGLNLGIVLKAIAIFLVIGAWLGLTVAILLIMEGLSAFLHALRLHWVEFNSKFYKGEGHKFYPFSFRKILKKEEN
ncbi:ATPase V0/A0 complex [Anaeromyces robustus]|jgi:V-type H+-transporting ATPase subunit a|uniref:V-type proton ATPase subunit a n=1 Tax=Anaeromyces robustus TaxID=1754192 RepID=A0A1Y1X0V2_9FUNG|nr:ATPase V0/A0 complex [Anaeromyces robustus]|eukprot:ORX79440.1 ATPase V0/A0 complex [Anaeromyces robustus]